MEKETIKKQQILQTACRMFEQQGRFTKRDLVQAGHSERLVDEFLDNQSHLGAIRYDGGYYKFAGKGENKDFGGV